MDRSRTAGLVLLVAMSISFAACGKKPAPQTPAPPPPPPPVVQEKPPAPPPPPPPAAKPTPPPPPRVPTEDEVFASKTLDQINSEAPLATVYFEYDKAELTDAARAILQKNSDWMRRWTSTRVVVEGHADSRGTNEYNLALGERRASAVREYLVGLGIAAARLTIRSQGEETPACREDTESCWSLNRRAFFIVTAK